MQHIEPNTSLSDWLRRPELRVCSRAASRRALAETVMSRGVQQLGTLRSVIWIVKVLRLGA
jgi:hypothetical protein